MARTIQDLITEARGYIQDSESDYYRYSDADLVTYLNDAIFEIRRLRPDVFVNSFDTDVSQFTTSNLSSNFPLPGQFFTATAYFIAGSAGLRDDEHVLEGRAMGLLNSFTAKVMTAGA